MLSSLPGRYYSDRHEGLRDVVRSFSSSLDGLLLSGLLPSVIGPAPVDLRPEFVQR